VSAAAAFWWQARLFIDGVTQQAVSFPVIADRSARAFSVSHADEISSRWGFAASMLPEFHFRTVTVGT
jgi:hypothetical protein